MRLVVTGSKGQLGTELLPLVEDRHEVLGLDLHNCDLTRRDQVLAAITSFRPDVVLHLAAYTAVDACETDVDTAYAVNALATRFIADGARRVGAHVVYVSTDYVFDGTKDSPYVEWDQPCPVSVYGRTKYAGELEIDKGWTIARTSWVCGARGKNIVKTVLGLARNGTSMRFVTDQIGHPTFTSDLAPMLVRLGVERAPGIFHTTNQGAVSWYEFVRDICVADGRDPDLVEPITTAQLDPPRPAPRPANSVLDDVAWRGHGFPRADHYSVPLARMVREWDGS